MKKSFIIIGIVMLICALLIAPCAAWSGSGTQASPWIISSQSDLARLSGTGYASYAGNDKYFQLGGSFSCSGTFTPIGNSANPFNGHFDGKEFTITGLKVSATCAGLFSYVTSGAEMKNIKFQSADITGTGTWEGAGVLYGQCIRATNTVTVSNVNVYDSKVTSAGDYVGGISGFGAYTSSTVKTTSCNVERTVITSSAGNNVGGISGIGAYTSSTHEIEGCKVNECVITAAGSNVGGISGFGADTSSTVKWIRNEVSNSVIISTAGDDVGGISGYGAYTSSTAVAESCNVENCYVYGKNGHTGGIFGYGTYGTGTACTVTNCNVEKVTVRADSNYVGGIYGSYRNNGGQPSVSRCTVTDSTVIGSSYTGGITGGYSSS